MEVIRNWKRFMAVGCSHGDKIDANAAAAVLRFKELWRPETTAHLGDFIDTAAFRSGAVGSNDEYTPIAPDIDAGLQFLDKLRPTILLNGNHEIRLWRLRNNHNAIVSDCANRIISSIETKAAALGALYVREWGIHAHVMLGDYKLMHGYLFSENACRDHAEAHGNVIHAHTHRAGVQKGRRDDCPTGYCVGTLSNVPAMEYASVRRSTLSWSGGLVWGEYCDDRLVCWLHEQPQGQVEWRLPI
jgi:hypothetical protein